MTEEVFLENPPGSRIEKVWTGIHGLADDLMGTFFEGDTWFFRQAATYGRQFIGDKTGGKASLWRLSPEGEQVMKDIYLALREGGRLEYIEAAYHFPDKLRAIASLCDDFIVGQVAHEQSLSRDKARDLLTSEARQKVTATREELERFLDGEVAKKAFSVEIDRKAGTFKIRDLDLNKKKILEEWDNSVALIFRP